VILPCDCTSPVQCLEATGGEQGMTAEEHEVARLRRELAESDDENARLRRERIDQEAVSLEIEIERLRRELAESRAYSTAMEVDRDGACADLAKMRVERDHAEAKSAAYERDWYAAKEGFGTAAAKLRDRVRDAERERDAAHAELAKALARCARLESQLADERDGNGRLCLQLARNVVAEREKNTWLRAAVEALVDELSDWPVQSPAHRGLFVRARALLAEVSR
jgi:hypothetical protein